MVFYSLSCIETALFLNNRIGIVKNTHMYFPHRTIFILSHILLLSKVIYNGLHFQMCLGIH